MVLPYEGTLRELYEYIVFSFERHSKSCHVCIRQIKGCVTDICGRHAVAAEQKALGLLSGESNCKLQIRRIVVMFKKPLSG